MAIFLLLVGCSAFQEEGCGTGMEFSSAFYGDTEFHLGGDWEGDARIYLFLDVVDGVGEGSIQADDPLVFQGEELPAHRSLPLQVSLCWEGDDKTFAGSVSSKYVDDLQLEVGGQRGSRDIWMLHQTDVEREYMDLDMVFMYCDPFFLEEGDAC